MGQHQSFLNLAVNVRSWEKLPFLLESNFGPLRPHAIVPAIRVGALMNFFAELKRRHIYRVAAAYAVVAWVLLQIVNNIAPGLNLPNWALTLVIVLLAMGFPIALVFAWIHQLASIDGTAARAATGKLDWALIGALVAVIALVSYQQIAPMAARTSQQASVIPGSSSAKGGDISLAVLPFVNLSPDKDQEFFSDGMTEEITAALAQIKGLHVVGRTSAFAYKGKNEDLRSIGRSLGATHVIEGSVRKAGNQLRITAQLIRAEDDSHLWAQNYDRELNDVFAIQEDIAQAIAASLQVPLGLKQGETLISGRTGDTESYEDYLRARAFFRSRNIKDAIAVLERSVARDPSNAAALGLLAEAYIFVPAYVQGATDVSVEQARNVNDSSLARAETAARQAIMLNPKNASAYSALADVETGRMKWKEAEDFFRQALTLDPDDPDALHMGSLGLAATGKIKRALEMRLKLTTLEPFVPIYNVNTAMTLLLNGRSEEAVTLLEAVPNQGGVGTVRAGYLALAHASAGQFAKAADIVLSIPADQVIVSRAVIVESAKLLREGRAKIAATEPSATSQNPEVHFVFAVRGAPIRALDALDYAISTNWPYSPAFMMVWSPVFAEARKTDRFKTLVRKAGLVDYWKARGWPDMCHPTTGDDFECN